MSRKAMKNVYDSGRWVVRFQGVPEFYHPWRCLMYDPLRLRAVSVQCITVCEESFLTAVTTSLLTRPLHRRVPWIHLGLTRLEGRLMAS